jgi:hypothetical protein
MDVYKAIKEMCALSERGIPFSFSFMSFSEDRQESKGIVEVGKARLRGRTSKKHNKNADFMENYLDTNEPKQFYHPLLMSFNNENLELS